MNMNVKKIVTDIDFKRLNLVLDDATIDLEAATNLEDALAGLSIVDATRAPRDLVTMNTIVRGIVHDQAAAQVPKIRTVTLVYPRATSANEGSVSVATPFGLKLLGAREGDEVQWSGRDGGLRRMIVTEVMYQPEASGDWHL